MNEYHLVRSTVRDGDGNHYQMGAEGQPVRKKQRLQRTET